MQLGFYFDQRRCTGCYTCVVACKQWNAVPAGPASWRRVSTMEEGRFPQVWVAHLSLSCCHCLEPACVTACPASAITKRDEDGIVLVDQSACIQGCRACLLACPYQSPQFRDHESKMEKCDFCLERLEQGEKPLCVASCPLRALDSGPLEELTARYGETDRAPGFADPTLSRPAIVFRPKDGRS
ncbi:MAG: 4Fe-4S dicluster domain-containing protein [Dehalococcoidia bacterium]|nr:4Fe-4S dicluster domain-containing protein [Dehalococcoidia bacterium]